MTVLPAHLAALTAAMADVLAAHRRALDLADANSKAEDDVYAELVEEHRDIAAQLHTAADRMVGGRDLPMGRHDERATTSAAFVDAFETLVNSKQELLTLLERQLDRDLAMLVEMRETIDAGR